ncbi:MAG TPA: SpoIIE family protein phosphatase [Terriglobales bacterium]|nr:SpoIIE family protein phosphatase [Terriglobales bacterium]
MPLSYQQIRAQLIVRGLWPRGRVARIGCYIVGLDIVLFVLGKVLRSFHSSWGQSLGGWVTFLTILAFSLFGILLYRWLKTKMLWRLRNRLIVTYVFIGVIPVVLLVTLAAGTFYLFVGQFSTYVVTAGLNAELRSLEAANAAIAHEIAPRLASGVTPEPASVAGLRRANKEWADRQLSVWLDDRLVLNSVPAVAPRSSPTRPSHLKFPFQNIVRDDNGLFLRVGNQIPAAGGMLTVISSEPFDQHLTEALATKLGEVTLYASGLNLSNVDHASEPPTAEKGNDGGQRSGISVRKGNDQYVLDTGKEPLTPTYTAGTVPPSRGFLDRPVSFATSVFVVNWATGDTSQPAAISVQTRFSMLYDRLFAALGDFAPAVEFGLAFVAIVFAIIELSALIIGTKLTRTVTHAVAQLYLATKHINRGDFSHRIPVRSKDQLAELANSFNSMTASIEKLIQEQKEKQRLENELVIAQEVQAQLFPKEISQLESLEVHGFCRPARTVSGDYYDFLAINSDKLILAVGDVSGKGISAALLMATIHSAVRAYSLEDLPVLRESVVVGAGAGSGLMLSSGPLESDISPASLLSLLNHQLYDSTPAEKYATLFLSVYDARARSIRYSNGGHLPPIVIAEDGSLRRLDCGGTVVGLFDHLSFQEASIQLHPGDIFIAYSDGVTEPENDFGEFGEERLIEVVSENRHLPLSRITEAVTAAVDDWIGPQEQPDDVTLVLARAR